MCTVFFLVICFEQKLDSKNSMPRFFFFEKFDINPSLVILYSQPFVTFPAISFSLSHGLES